MLRDLFSLFPAYAGVIPMAYVAGYVTKTFPRICGGDPDAVASRLFENHFSPHMRG